MLQIKNLFKKYKTGSRSLAVIENLSLEIPQGSFATIRGASGSGKSTLLHLMGGLDLPDSGEILWNQKGLHSFSQSELATWRNQSVGFIFQSYQLLHELNTLENVELPSLIQGNPNKSLSKELLKKVGLQDRWDHRPLELSGGEQQRVAIARALRNSPQLLLADEPTGNLDQETAQGIIELLLNIQKEEKTTLILVTHDPKIASMGEHQWIMENHHIRSLS